jgi:hypothetical protein
MKSLGVIAAALVLAGCGSSTAGVGSGGGDVNTHDGAGHELVLQGRVALGTPVAGATVRALVNEEDGSWREVSEGISDDGGIFEITVPADRVHRPLRLVATGETAQYTEAADGATVTLGATARLVVDLESATTHEGTVVHLSAWTTLAGCVAEAYAAGHQVDGGIGWTEATLLARRRIRDHLAGTSDLDLPATAPSDLSMGPWPYPNPSTTLGLAAAGLSGLVRFGEGPPGTSAALVAHLCRDLSDGLFDGVETVDAGPRPLTAPPGIPVLDADTTRFALAAATHGFLGSPRDASGVAEPELAAPGGYYETISFDDGPLYPPATAPTRFDPIPPTLEFTADSPGEDTAVGAPFVLTVTGEDPWGTVLVRFEATEPGGLLAPDGAGTPDLRALEVDPAELGVQGPLRFIFAGADPQGNTAEISRRLLVDTIGPASTVLAPDPEICHETWVEPVLLVVTDDGSGVAAVETEDGAPCALSKGDEWACPPPPEGGVSATYAATDGAGNVTAVTVWFCPDLDPPAITFGAPAALGFWGPAYPTITATLSDPAGISAWAVLDGEIPVVPLAVDAADPLAVVLTLPLPDGGDAIGWNIEGTDGRGNTGVTPLSLIHDAAPPDYATETDPAVPLGSAWKVSFRIAVTDALSGVAAVQVVSPGTWDVTAEAGGVVLIEGVPDLPPGGMGLVIPVELEATDLVGNTSTHGVGIVNDDAPPVLTWHTTGFVDETDCTVSPGAEGPEYACAGTVVLLGPDACSTGCPPIRKLASRLSYQAPGDIQAQNLPALHFEVHDLLPGQMADPGGQYPVTLIWTFTRAGAVLTSGQALLSNLLGTEIKVPLSSEVLFGVPPEEATLSPATIPDAVEITATDAAGNPATLAIPLEIDILPPLLHVTSAASELGAALDGEPADVAGNDDVEATRLTLANLSKLPVALALGDIPEHRIQFAVGSAYLRGDPAVGICTPGACLYEPGAPDASTWDPAECQGPIVLDWGLLPEGEAALSVALDDPDGVLEWNGDEAILPGGASVDAVISVSLAGIPPITPGEALPVWVDGAWEEHTVRFLEEGVEEWAICGMTLQFAAAFEISPALRLMRTRTPLDASDLQVIRTNPQGSAIMVDVIDAGWDRVHEATWPLIPMPPDVTAGW